MRIPKRLNRNPIVDAIAEVRFTSSLPSEAILGVVYENVRENFGKPATLPILQLPTVLREKDPNLKYQACYKFTKPGNVLLVGPHNVALSTNPYTDWDTTTPVLSDLLSRFDEIELFQSIERIGLRYINFFEKLNIFEHLTLSLAVNSQSIAKQSIVLRTEAPVEGFKVITNIANAADTSISGQQKKGSILDLDVIHESPDVSKESTPEALIRLFTRANKLADDAFFGLMKEEFLDKFEPVY